MPMTINQEGENRSNDAECDVGKPIENKRTITTNKKKIIARNLDRTSSSKAAASACGDRTRIATAPLNFCLSRSVRFLHTVLMCDKTLSVHGFA